MDKKSKKEKKDKKKRDRNGDVSNSGSSKREKREGRDNLIPKETREQKKSRKKIEKIAKALGYTNESNPFGDPNLLQPFVWFKKLELQKKIRLEQQKKGLPVPTDEETEQNVEESRLHLMREIEKVRQNRELRAQEKIERNRLRNEEQRLLDEENFGDWRQKEEDFHIDLIKTRCYIRLYERRPKAIDIIATNVLLCELVDSGSSGSSGSGDSAFDTEAYKITSLSMEHRDPIEIIALASSNNFNNHISSSNSSSDSSSNSSSMIDTLKELKEDAESFLIYEQKNGSSSSSGSSGSSGSSSSSSEIIQFWTSIMAVVQGEIDRYIDENSNNNNSGGSSSSGSIHNSVNGEVRGVLRGKSLDQLQALQTNIRTVKLKGSNSGSSGSTGSSEDIHYWHRLDREIVLEMHRVRVMDYHSKLVSREGEVMKGLELIRNRNIGTTTTTSTTSSSSSSDDYSNIENEVGDEWVQMATWDEVALQTSVNQGKKDNKSFPSRSRGHYDQASPSPSSSSQYQYLNDDRYRPRKPRYINSVRTGWDWNKYNKTHYDYDNPPPKTVQGYRFNIFYPDLIDKTITPSFKIEPSSTSSGQDDASQFAVLRFTAGPPYEDIAFQILNKEWDANRRAGFKSTFNRGVLQLHFNFKRHFYRR